MSLIIKYEMKYKHESNSKYVWFVGKFKSTEHFVQFECNERSKNREIRQANVLEVRKGE